MDWFLVFIVCLTILEVYLLIRSRNYSERIYRKILNNIEDAAKRSEDAGFGGKELWLTRNHFKELHDKYIILRERFKYDNKVRKQVERDWVDFLRCQEEVDQSINALDFASAKSIDKLHDKVNESHIKMREIEKKLISCMEK